MILSGLTKNAHITDDGNMTTAGTIRMDGSNSSTLFPFTTQLHRQSYGQSRMMDGVVLNSLSLTGTLGNLYAIGASAPNIELDQNGRESFVMISSWITSLEMAASAMGSIRLVAVC